MLTSPVVLPAVSWPRVVLVVTSFYVLCIVAIVLIVWPERPNTSKGLEVQAYQANAKYREHVQGIESMVAKRGYEATWPVEGDPSRININVPDGRSEKEPAQEIADFTLSDVIAARTAANISDASSVSVRVYARGKLIAEGTTQDPDSSWTVLDAYKSQ